MNKKALVALPVFTVVMFLVLTAMFFWFNVNEEKIKEEIGFGEIQSDLFNTYFEAEKDSFYYEKKIEYAILKTNTDFKSKGGMKLNCNSILKFGTDCELDSSYYLELLKENIKEISYSNLKLEKNIVTITIDKTYSKKGEDYDYTYTKEINIQKKIGINLEELKTLKENIKTCLQNNDLSKNCLKYTKEENNILIYEIDIEPNFYDNSPLEFKLDLDDTGVITSIIN